jgi:hypothetical protein
MGERTKRFAWLIVFILIGLMLCLVKKDLVTSMDRAGKAEVAKKGSVGLQEERENFTNALKNLGDPGFVKENGLDSSFVQTKEEGLKKRIGELDVKIHKLNPKNDSSCLAVANPSDG